jgi:hypothetical protein
MKSHSRSFLFGLALTMLITYSCTQSRGISVATSRVAASNVPTSNPYQTSTSTRDIGNATLESPPTASPVQSPAPTQKPSLSATITAAPTLGVEDARFRLSNLLSNNGNCRLPCLWGITPGKTTFQEAWSKLVPLSSISDFIKYDPGLGNMYLNYSIEDGLSILIDIAFAVKNDVVSYVGFQAQILQEWKGEQGERGFDSIFDSSFFGEQLSQYMLPQILSAYGQPEAVLLATPAEFPPPQYGQGHFRVLILYPDQGILVHYRTEMRVVGQNVMGCLTNAHVELALLPTGYGSSFYDLLAPTKWPDLINNYIPLEEVTSMSLDDFYQTFRQPTDKCLETPARFWPTPEK